MASVQQRTFGSTAVPYRSFIERDTLGQIFDARPRLGAYTRLFQRASLSLLS